MGCGGGAQGFPQQGQRARVGTVGDLCGPRKENIAWGSSGRQAPGAQQPLCPGAEDSCFPSPPSDSVEEALARVRVLSRLS